MSPTSYQAAPPREGMIAEASGTVKRIRGYPKFSIAAHRRFEVKYSGSYHQLL
jgi:hypothetical protein